MKTRKRIFPFDDTNTELPQWILQRQTEQGFSRPFQHLGSVMSLSCFGLGPCSFRCEFSRPLFFGGRGTFARCGSQCLMPSRGQGLVNLRISRRLGWFRWCYCRLRGVCRTGWWHGCMWIMDSGRWGPEGVFEVAAAANRNAKVAEGQCPPPMQQVKGCSGARCLWILLLVACNGRIHQLEP